MPNLKTLDDVYVAKKTVLVRVDLNLPIDPDTERVADSYRVAGYAETVRELAEQGAKVVVLAHQGRTGDPSCISMKHHASLFAKHVGRPVTFIDNVVGAKVQAAIREMEAGSVILLENVRMLTDEMAKKSPVEHASSEIVQGLKDLVDLFVLDAFSVAHRSQASVVGFTAVLPSYAGRALVREIEQGSRALDPTGINLFVLGGAKPQVAMDIVDYMLEHRPDAMDVVLTCGIIGQIFLAAQGKDLNELNRKFFQKKGFDEYIPQAQRILSQHGDRIRLPVDVACIVDGGRQEFMVAGFPPEGMIMDIGSQTMQQYQAEIHAAQSIVFNGPPGVFEDPLFDRGTKALLEAISTGSGFSLIGGGDSVQSVDHFRFPHDQFGHISLGGGALIQFLTGTPLPGVVALEAAAQRMG